MDGMAGLNGEHGTIISGRTAQAPGSGSRSRGQKMANPPGVPGGRIPKYRAVRLVRIKNRSSSPQAVLLVAEVAKVGARAIVVVPVRRARVEAKANGADPGKEARVPEKENRIRSVSCSNPCYFKVD